METERDIIDVRNPVVKATAQREYKLLQLGWRDPSFTEQRYIYTPPPDSDLAELFGFKRIKDTVIERIHEDFSVDVHFTLPNKFMPSGRALYADPARLEIQPTMKDGTTDLLAELRERVTAVERKLETR